jgi:phosphatidylglycerol:prolipoprotein diacylglycerol transferase
LIYLRNKFLHKPGTISGLFLIFYSIFRFFVEFFRMPDEQLGYVFLNLSMGQVVSLIFVLSGVLLFYIKNENH